MGSLLEHTSDAMEKVIKRQKSDGERYDSGRHSERAKQYFDGMPDPKAWYQPDEGDGYRGTHKAPSGENGEGSLDAMDRTYPEDIYSPNGARYYGTRDNSDAEMISIIHKMRGKPDELVTVYRAVPKGTKGEINAGDWVTPSKAYARLHGGRWEEGMRIIEKKVPAGEIFTEGNSIYEFGWSPKKKSRADVLREEIASEEKWMERRRSQAPVLWETKGSKIYGQRMDIEKRISSLKYELNNLKQKARYQPAEYQGGDDYYKQSANPFESKDEQGLKIRKARVVVGNEVKWNPERISWVEIGHYFGWGKTKDVTPENEMFIRKNSGLWAMNLDNDKFSKINPFTEKERAKPLLTSTGGEDFRDLTHMLWFDKGTEWKKDYKDKAFGRYELPMYSNGKLERRGKFSITAKSRINDMTVSELKEMKQKIAGNFKIKEGDFDLYYFEQTESVKNAFGLSKKDELPVKLQPAEGWRDWQSERTSVGSVIKNTAGYVIMVQGDKYKVYNPYKAMIGIYDNEDQAKRRVQKDEPRR
jgi:hypothetical protein